MSREIGANAEHAAAQYLISGGFRILQQNYAIRGGELDIIAMDGCDVVFVEVKYRASFLYGMPRENVTVAKQRRICKTALSWLQENELSEANVRFDIVEISPQGIVLLKAAFPFTE